MPVPVCPTCGQPLEHRGAVARVTKHLAFERRKLAVAEARGKKAAREDADRAAEERLERRTASLRAEVERLKRRVERKTPGERGQPTEDEMAAQLKAAFPQDRIALQRIGGDILHEVMFSERVVAGTIVYECKDVGRWSSKFLEQARAAGNRHKAMWTVLICSLRPRAFVPNGVIVIPPSELIALAAALRRAVLELSRKSLSPADRDAKTEMVFRYVTGMEFRRALERIVEATGEARSLLRREEDGHQRVWRRRTNAYSAILAQTTAIDETVREIVETKRHRPRVVALASRRIRRAVPARRSS